MRIETMEDLFLEQIQDLYDAEERLIKALPKMAEATTTRELRSAFEEHLGQTRGHRDRLEQVFAELGQEASGETCEAMKGLIEEAEEMMDDIKASPLRDAGLIAAANRVEHYEMAGYGTARTMASALGLNRSASLLEQTLEEEKQADAKLTQIAEQKVNKEAIQMGGKTRRAG
jgi:ferritin-like metal-binding protein YciE